MTTEELDKEFPPGYWGKFQTMFAHNFFDTHKDRTIRDYQQHLIPLISSKTLLEVGGFPGLALGLFRHYAKSISAIDPEEYKVDFYVEWLREHHIESLTWDITKTVWPQDWDDRHWDVAIISDVLLHLDGFPTAFVDWLKGHADTIIFVDYEEANTCEMIKQANAFTLHAGFNNIPKMEFMLAHMDALGLECSDKQVFNGRRMLVFRSKPNAKSDAD